MSDAGETPDDVEVVALDTGGTMTDSFIISDDGDFTIGKAPTTPDDESEGILQSVGDAMGYWGTSVGESIDTVETAVYSGTAMLNRLVEREGNDDIGVITTAGFEDHHRMGRAIQSWGGLDYGGRLHGREHEHPEPLVDRDHIVGVRERVNFHGEAIIPLYEAEVEEAVEELLDKGVESICVCLLYSYLNPEHEHRVRAIAEEVTAEYGVEVPVVLSCEHNPIRRETPRLNTLIIDQYAVEPSRDQLLSIRDQLQDEGMPAPLRVMTSHGSTVSPEHDRLVSTLVSGPVGGVVGSEYLAAELGIENLVCTDVGGTSFDVTVITEEYAPTRWEDMIDKFLLNVPMMSIDTIGAGTGMYVRHNDVTDSLEFGPESAGHLVGISNRDADIDTVTMTDCSLALGYINPDYFLGGDLDLDRDRAEEAIRDQLAEPLGEGVHRTARGALDLIDLDMQNYLDGMVEGLGFAPENYTCLSYGGGGPLHVAGYTQGMNFEDVIVPNWAAAFSAFGCGCADYSYRHDRSMDVMIEPDGSSTEFVARQLTEVWAGMREAIEAEFAADNRDPERMEFTPRLRLQYAGLVNDLEVTSPTASPSVDDVERLLDRYDERFESIYRRGTKSPERGYQVTKVIGEGTLEVTKPEIPTEQRQGPEPPAAAEKGSRDIFWADEWHSATLWEMNTLQPGNVVEGPAVVEAPSTTLLLPPGTATELDERRLFHLREEA